ncbi:MAG: extracellular solute-binding protein [Treponema sp.]|jgi:multiple sugar transport system substrate-binding protein|nr:extracellular solute-binding protein [Treponema sp.]
MVTIKDVAKLAGVSIATVSCALSGKKNVSHSTRVKIMAAIEKLNYIPNESARRLKIHTSRDIGVLLTSIDDLYHSEIFKGITAVIQKNQYFAIIGFSNNQPKTEIEIINDFISRNFAGILLISCLANDSSYIKKLLACKIPIVFIERQPRTGNINFAGISNGKTITYLVEELNKKDYRRILLFCGNPEISSESDSADAFRKICADRNLAVRLCYTNMTEEDAFRVALAELYSNPNPDAVIATSGNIARGIMEGAGVLGISLSDSLVIVFSEETWMDTRYLPKVLHTSRPAFSLGTGAAELLIRTINGASEKSETLILDDNILKSGITIPRRRRESRNIRTRKTPELRLLLLDSSFAVDPIKILARKFRNDCGISLVLETVIQDKLLEHIIEDAQSYKPRYDVYMFDIPWLSYLVQNNFLEDLTGLVTGDRLFFNSVTPETMENSRYRDRYYSVPFAGGAQIMFYRSDLFDDPIISRDYYNEYKTKLRPPKTWSEYNMAARFFTRSFNKASPVEFGTSCPGTIPEELCPEIYSRIWGFGGRYFTGKGLPLFNTENCRLAFDNLLDLQNYTPSPVFSTAIPDVVRDFYTGKTAMIITFTEFAPKIMDAINGDIFGKLGLSFIPGRCPISIGWNFGINSLSRNKDRAWQFFKWLYRKDVSYYLTILNGQSSSIHSYENNNLLKLYPWMRITLDNYQYVRKRAGGNKKNSIIVPWNKIEDIIFHNTKLMFEGEAMERCLKAMDTGITDLMTVYGHFRGNN